MDIKVGKQLAKFTVETKYVDIPQDILDFTKGLTLKTVAGMVAGSSKLAGRKTSKFIKDRRLTGEVGVVGCGFKTSLWEAVFLHALFAHASELEDDKFGEGFAWDITVIPLLFSLAQKVRLSGKALMEALVVGLEIHARSLLFPHDYSKNRALMATGAVGPAAGAAKALGLSVEETASAIGLSMSGNRLLVQNFGTDAHYFESALHALQGMMAADMAKEGLTCNPDAGNYLCDLGGGSERVEPQKVVGKLGKEWSFRLIGIKKYPACFHTQRAIDVLLELKKKHKLTYDQVASIEVHGSPVEDIVNRPEPKVWGDLQFSLQHTLGCAMLDGDLNEEHTTEEALVNPKLKEARDKVKVIIHEDWPAVPLAMPARVIIKTKDGKKYSGERMYLIGSPELPLTMEQFRELYFKYTGGVLSQDQIEKTADAIMNLEKLSDVDELMDILTFRHRIHV